MTLATFNTWLKATRPLERIGDTLRIAVPNERVQDWLDHRLRKTIDRALDHVAPGLSAQFVLPPDAPTPSASRTTN
jgi:chromosomal replication initiation ATPase DnaA